MAISLRAAGTPTGATAAVTAINPSPPAGWVSGDISLLHVHVKPETTTITTPSGWTKIGEWTGGAGTFGADSGPGKTALYYRLDSPVAPGNIAFTGADSACGVINIFAKTAATWDIANTGLAVDLAHNSNYFATNSTPNLDLDAGDLLIGTQYSSSDGGSVSAETIAATGCTFDAVSVVSERAVSTGNDHRARVVSAAVLTGPSSAGPEHSYNNLQGASGHTSWLRLREISGTAPDTPTGLTVTDRTATSLRLNWNAATGSPTGYTVRIDGGAPTVLGDVLTYNFTGLTEATTYTLEVRADNSFGSSSYASTTGATLAPGNPARDFTYQMNRLAGTLDANDVPKLAATGAANVYAGTTDLELTAALNVKAGNSLPNYKTLQGVLNQLAGTTDLGIVEAASEIEA